MQEKLHGSLRDARIDATSIGSNRHDLGHDTSPGKGRLRPGTQPLVQRPRSMMTDLHCTYCDEMPRLRSGPHCRDCGRPGDVTVDGLCPSCASYRNGNKAIFSLDAAHDFLAAIVTRARLDEALPVICDEGDAHRARDCAHDYLTFLSGHADMLRADGGEVFLMVARLAEAA